MSFLKTSKDAFTASELRNFIQTDIFYNCIVHHTVKIIPENELKKTVHKCRKTTPETVRLQNHLDKLYESGVLDHLLTPKNDEVNYRLTPKAKRAYMKTLTTKDKKYNHPKLSQETKRFLRINEF